MWGDRLVFVRNLFKQGVMSDLEYSLYCHQHTFALEQCPDASPDAILYLKTSPEICLERLKHRGRRFVSLFFVESSTMMIYMMINFTLYTLLTV